MEVCPACGSHVRRSTCCPHCGRCVTGGGARTVALLLGLAAVSPACSTSSPDYSGPGLADDDGDGTIERADCNDKDPDVHPGAEETKGDGVDSNCDGGDNT